MFTIEDYAGKRGPLRDERGRFRRKTWEELGILGQSTARLAAQLSEQIEKDIDFFSGDKWPKTVRIRRSD